MAHLFELSAALALDTSAFTDSLMKAESSARALQISVNARMSAAASAMQSLQSTAAASWQGIAASIQSAIDKARQYISLSTPSAAIQGFATGIDYVPHDDFPARLHQGEAVLTRLEAAQWRGASAPQTVDPAAIAQAVASAMTNVSVQMDGQTVGRLVAPAVDQALSASARARRYA